MKILVYGAGALGSVLGATLARAHDVTLLARRDHAEAVNRAGLLVEGKAPGVARVRAVTDLASAPNVDLVLLTVKAYDTAAAARALRAFVGPSTRVLTLQNGLGNLEVLRASFPAAQVLAGAITVGATMLEPGRVRHAGFGYCKIGSASGNRKDAEEVARALAADGLPIEAVDDPESEIWAKVVVNAGINPVTAITGLPNGALLEHAWLTELMTSACEEAIEVAKAEGVALPDDDLLYRARKVAEMTAANKSSMLQDVERGKRTEIDAISGEIVRRGRARGVDVPVSATLAALVKGIELTTRRG